MVLNRVAIFMLYLSRRYSRHRWFGRRNTPPNGVLVSCICGMVCKARSRGLLPNWGNREKFFGFASGDAQAFVVICILKVSLRDEPPVFVTAWLAFAILSQVARLKSGMCMSIDRVAVALT